MKNYLDELYRNESRRILATLIRKLGDFDLAEEVMHDAFAEALRRWTSDGVPEKPVPWLISTARFKAIDQLRRRKTFTGLLPELEREAESAGHESDADANQVIEDDRLRLIFICCHPDLPQEAQLALTLREVCGMTTEEVARALLGRTAAVAQRIVRAKQKIRADRIPYEIPEGDEIAARLQSVLAVIYLIFNEGYSASSGEAIVRRDLTSEAIRLGRLLSALLPHPEVAGLIALMLLQDSRQAARTDADGELVRLEDQDRSLWDQDKIAEGRELVTRALLTRRFGSYTLQAAIAAVHADAPSVAATDWAQVVGLYDALLSLQDTPVIRLNRAVAVAMRDGPDAGLRLAEALIEEGELDNYYLCHAAIADFHRQLGNHREAVAAYERALALTAQAPEQRFLRRRLAELSAMTRRDFS
jgi:RNA polymerase sigma-70 factor (ECF subfamily)